MHQLEEMVPMESDLVAKSTLLSSVVNRLNDLLATGLPTVPLSPDEDGKKEPEGANLDDTQLVTSFSRAKPEAGQWKPKREQDTACVVNQLLDNLMVKLSV